jgi:glutaredoxin 3
MSRAQAARVTMYRTRSCPFCVAAADFLDARGIAYDEVMIDDHPDRQGFTASLKPGHYTVPLIVIGDRPLGGYDDLRAADARGELDRLLGVS